MAAPTLPTPTAPTVHAPGATTTRAPGATPEQRDADRTELQRLTGHLGDDDVAALGAELDAIRDRIVAERGEVDAAYIRRVVKL